MIAYHGEQSEKDEILAQLRGHMAADQLIKGTYWEEGRGCGIGCTVHSGDHALYEPRFGIPRYLAWLEDRIFECLPHKDAMTWPLRFMSAIQPGADLSEVWPDFAVWLLTDPEFGVLHHANDKRSRQAIEDVTELYAKREPMGGWCWRLAQEAAAAAAADYAVDGVYHPYPPAAVAAAAAATYTSGIDHAYSAGSAADVASNIAALDGHEESFWHAAAGKLVQLLSTCTLRQVKS